MGHAHIDIEGPGNDDGLTLANCDTRDDEATELLRHPMTPQLLT